MMTPSFISYSLRHTRTYIHPIGEYSGYMNRCIFLYENKSIFSKFCQFLVENLVIPLTVTPPRSFPRAYLLAREHYRSRLPVPQTSVHIIHYLGTFAFRYLDGIPKQPLFLWCTYEKLIFVAFLFSASRSFHPSIYITSSSSSCSTVRSLCSKSKMYAFSSM